MSIMTASTSTPSLKGIRPNLMGWWHGGWLGGPGFTSAKAWWPSTEIRLLPTTPHLANIDYYLPLKLLPLQTGRLILLEDDDFIFEYFHWLLSDRIQDAIFNSLSPSKLLKPYFLHAINLKSSSAWHDPLYCAKGVDPCPPCRLRLNMDMLSWPKQDTRSARPNAGRHGLRQTTF